jgi:hypothetical protein
MSDCKNKFLTVLLLSLLILGLGACRGVKPSQPTEEYLRNRVEGLLEARDSRNLKKMKEFYLDPEEAKIGNIRYLKGEITNIIIDGESAEVKVSDTFKAMGFTFRDVKRKQYWIWNGKDWFLDTRKKKKNPFTSN